MHEDVSVAIASFNTLPLLRVVAGAVRATAPGAEIVICDTGSTDGSREWTAARPWLRLEALPPGLLGAPAHAAALDRALEVTSRPLLCALDSDAVPLDPGWLSTLRHALDAPPAATAAGTTKDPSEVGFLRVWLARLSGKRPGPEWTYLRPNRALYRREAIARAGLGFDGRPLGEPQRVESSTLHFRVGEALARALASQPGGVRLLAPGRMEAMIAHVRHATLALNPALFLDARARDVRAARRRVDAFLACEVARRWTAEAERR